MDLQEYTDQLFGGEEPQLARMREEAEQEGLPAIQVPVEVGRLLQLLIVQTRATKVLEIGTLFGYSSIVMGRVLPAGGKIISLEVNSKHQALAQKNISSAGLSQKIEIRLGNALDSLQKLEGQEFDFIFIDADKDTYPQYLQWALKLSHEGSMIAADNVWRHGAVAEPPDDDQAAVGIATFNKELASNPRLLATIVPARNCTDAVALATVKRS
ncbi:MAG: O-methyltransferase [Chloroflexota bacterium]